MAENPEINVSDLSDDEVQKLLEEIDNKHNQVSDLQALTPDEKRKLLDDWINSPHMKRVREIEARENRIREKQAEKQFVHILIIDNSNMSIRVIQNSLKAHKKFIVDQVYNGWQALDYLKVITKYDAIMIEADLPGFSGWEVIESIKEAGYDYPFVLMTMYDEQIYKDLSKKHGVATMMLKPLNPQKVAESISKVVKKT